MNILFIAFEFPPLSRGGVFRSAFFSGALTKFNINPIVITLHPESFEAVYDDYSVDQTIGKNIRETTAIVPLRSASVKDKNKLGKFINLYFSIHGNETKHWKKNMYHSLDDIIKKFDPKAIYATVPPFGVLSIAFAVSKKYNLPLVYDFRDAWSQWRTAPYGSIFHYWRTLHLEKKYLSHADAVIATSKQTLADFQELHPAVKRSLFHYIPNGYTGSLDKWTGFNKEKDTILIGYVGSFYYSPTARDQMLKPWWKKRGHRMLQYIPQKQDWLYRSPYFFFKTLQDLMVADPALYKRIKVQFAGKIPDWLRSMIEAFQLNEKIELLGELSHTDALSFQKNCDLLLITSAKRIGGKDYSIAGKTFEYIKTQKPILAFVCDGAQKDILQDTGMAIICDPDDSGANVDTIIKFAHGAIELDPDHEFLKTLSRDYHAEELAAIINSVACKN